jgi:hypothetical protein
LKRRIVCDLLVWFAAAWAAVLLRFGPENISEYIFGHLGAFILLGVFWTACRATSYWAAARLGRRRISVLLTTICPILVVIFCGALSYAMFTALLGRGVLILILIPAGYMWGLLSELIFDPTRQSRHEKGTGQHQDARYRVPRKSAPPEA